MQNKHPPGSEPIPLSARLQILGTFTILLTPGTTLSWFLIENTDATSLITAAAALILAIIHQDTATLRACRGCGMYIRDICNRCFPKPDENHTPPGDK